MSRQATSRSHKKNIVDTLIMNEHHQKASRSSTKDTQDEKKEK